MSKLNKILAEREGWTDIHELSGVVYGSRGGWDMGDMVIPTYDNDTDLDRVIRGLDKTDLAEYAECLMIVFNHWVMDAFTATPQQKRQALAKVFGVEEAQQ